jgi:hypothetical protein
MVNLLNAIYEQLKNFSVEAYNGKVPDDAVYPFISYNIVNSVDIDGCESGSREDFILEVDIWDNISDTLRIETLVNSIDNAINRIRYKDSNIFACFYRITRLNLPDADENLSRWQLRYRVPVWRNFTL